MAPEKAQPIEILPRAKVWLEVDDEYVFGLGICRILEAVEETGSIKNAATVVEKSYRHIWARIKDVEKRLGISLVETHVGGASARRSSLTKAARDLVSRYRRLRQDVFQLVDKNFSDDLREIVDKARSDSEVQ